MEDNKPEKTVKKAESPTLIDLKNGIKRRGSCHVCGRDLPITTPALWNKDTDELTCYDCRQYALSDKAFLNRHLKERESKRLLKVLAEEIERKTQDYDRIDLLVKETQTELEANKTLLRIDEFLRNKQGTPEQQKAFENALKDHKTFVDGVCSYADKIVKYENFWIRKRKKKVEQQQEQETR